MANEPRRTRARAEPEPTPKSRWSAAAAVLLLAAAPVAFLQALVNSGGDAPRWARDWNGFRMADDARGRLSGDPENPHYRDLALLWRGGQYFPLAYTRKAVEDVTERVIHLLPR